MVFIKNNVKIGSLIVVELCRIWKFKEKWKVLVSDLYFVFMLVVIFLLMSF